MAKKKNPVGRPSKYRPEYCQQMIEFFSQEPDAMRVDTKVVESIELGGQVMEDTPVKIKDTKKGSGINLPTFVRFGLKIGVCHDTLIEWKDVHTEFSEAYGKCKELQEDVWKINSLNGNYNSSFAIFLGKNVFGYKDKSEVQMDGNITVMPTIKLKGGKELKLDIGLDPEGDKDESS